MKECSNRDRGFPSGQNYPLAVIAVLLAFLVSVRATLVVEVGANFTGSTYGIDSVSLPADGNGAAGLAHYVELINGRFSVYDKALGTRILTMPDLQFWTNAGAVFAAGVDVTDPRLLFDPATQRWFAACVDFDANQGGNRFLLAISKTADPTGAWQATAFASDPTRGGFGDFPTLGLDANAVYLGADVFDSVTGNELGMTLVSIPKAGLLADPPNASARKSFGVFSISAHGDILQPVVNPFSSTASGLILAVANSSTDLRTHANLKISLVNNAGGPGTPTLSSATTITTSSYTCPLNPLQPDGNDTLDDGDARLSATAYQVGNIIYAVHGTQIAGRAAIRWYAIHADTRVLLQSGNLTDPNLDLFYPSIAANASGTVVIGCNGCSLNTYVSAYAFVGETVNGTIAFGDWRLLKAGEASYYNVGADGLSRWGDYSSTSVDPADPNRFWTLQLIPTDTLVWRTQITEIRTAIATLTIAKSGSDVVVSWPGTAIDFTLESAPDLQTPTNWTAVHPAFTTNNGVLFGTVPAAQAAQFFRLRQP